MPRPERAGKGFEAVLAFVHERYVNQGRALIVKTATSGAFVRKGATVVFAARKSLPDYIGLLVGSGRAIVFDAKSTASKDGWTLDDRYLHQARAIVEWSSAGALAFFLVESRPLDAAFAVFPPPDFGPFRDRENLLMLNVGSWRPKISFNPDEKGELVVRIPIVGGVCDWLSKTELGGDLEGMVE